MAPIEEREQTFKENLSKFSNQFDFKLLSEFFDYWTEPTHSGKKMRFELEKTWDLSRRLHRWFDNKNKWHGQSTNHSGNPSPKPGTSEARIIAIRKWVSGSDTGASGASN